MEFNFIIGEVYWVRNMETQEKEYWHIIDRTETTVTAESFKGGIVTRNIHRMGGSGECARFTRETHWCSALRNCND